MVRTDRLEIFQHLLIERMRADRCAVTNDDKLATRASQRHIHATNIGQKADLAISVRTDERNHDSLFFAALKPVDRVDFEALGSKQFSQQSHLRGVRRDDGDLPSDQACSKQRLDFARDQPRLRFVQTAFAIRFRSFVIACAGGVNEIDRCNRQFGFLNLRQIVQPVRCNHFGSD